MIRQIRFLKGECGWVNFPNGAIKLGVVNGNEVINVLSCQTEGFRDGTRTSQEKRIIAAILQLCNKSVTRGAQFVPLGIPRHCWKTRRPT